MKIKCEFTYKCEIKVTKEEAEILKGKYVEKERLMYDLASEVNNFFLVGDGRNEVGVVTDFNLEVKE